MSPLVKYALLARHESVVRAPNVFTIPVTASMNQLDLVQYISGTDL